MSTKYILNDRVLFLPAENKLTPLGGRGSEVVLHAPVSRILLLLVIKQGAVVLQNEIFHEVWEKLGQRVAPSTLYQNVSLLRKALKKSGVVTLTIKTYPKEGFSYKGSVQVLDDSDESENTEENKSNSAPAAETVDIKSAKPTKNTSVEVNQKAKIKRNINITTFPRAAILTLIIALSFGFFNLPSSTDEKFTAEQEIVARVNGCPVYVDRGNRKVELSRILVYLRERGLKCIEHEFLYLIKNPNQEDVMVMTCNSDERDFKCTRTLKLPLYLTPKPKE